MRSISSVLSDFIDMIYDKFGKEHKLTRMANDVVVAYTLGAGDEELAQMISGIIKEVDELVA